MKLKIKKKDLLSLVGKAQQVVEKRNTMPILVNVLLEASRDQLSIFATNLEVSLTDSTTSNVETPGKVAINAKSLFDVIKELPEGDVTLEKQKNNWLNISMGKSVFNFVGVSPDEYPVFPTVNISQFTKVKSNVFAGMIEKTMYSVSNDETRYHLNGVYFERVEQSGKPIFKMVATDGHRLSLVSRELSEKTISGFEKGVIIPRRGLLEIRKLLESPGEEFEIAVEGAQLIIRKETATLMIRLIEGKYPNYQQLIPQNLGESVAINRSTLLSSLKRVSLLSNQKSKGVTLSLSSGTMEITSNNPELGDAREEIRVDYSGKDFKIGFNAKYILDALGSIEEEDVQFELKDQLSPGLMRFTEDSNYTCVIMPMRI